MTRRLMPVHGGATFGRSPPPDMFYALIDMGANHWLWDGDFHDDNELRYPIVRWAPRIDRPATIYVVARVVWEYAFNASLFRRKLYNECGVIACLCPSHFSVDTKPALMYWTLPDPCVLQDGSHWRIARRHEVDHIRNDDGLVMACGVGGAQPSQSQPPGSTITCANCVYVWRALGRPIVEAMLS